MEGLKGQLRDLGTVQAMARFIESMSDEVWRDLFAGFALVGLLANAADGEHSTDDFAEFSYRYADSMMALRDRKSGVSNG